MPLLIRLHKRQEPINWLEKYVASLYFQKFIVLFKDFAFTDSLCLLISWTIAKYRKVKNISEYNTTSPYLNSYSTTTTTTTHKRDSEVYPSIFRASIFFSVYFFCFICQPYYFLSCPRHVRFENVILSYFTYQG